jgi:hypothetical protein
VARAQGMKLSIHLRLVLSLRMVELYLHSPICPHGLVMLSSLSPGITLRLLLHLRCMKNLV